MKSYTLIDLILDEEQRVYHLKARREQLAQTIITVGDPGRVEKVSRHFDRIEHRISNREFVTHTGYIGKKQLSVISTGIGTGNIDIVLNEIDSIFNIDPVSRHPVAEPLSLDFIRIGTSGALQPELVVDSLFASEYSIGLDSMMLYYAYKQNEKEHLLLADFKKEIAQPYGLPCYVASCNPTLFTMLVNQEPKGITLTTPGFFGAQGRQLRGELSFPELFDQIANVTLQGRRIQNFEMETAALYGLAKILGHRALSFSVILPNRASQTFSANPEQAIERRILGLLEKIAQLPDDSS